MEKKTGTVKKIFYRRGFAFLTPNDGGDDVMLHFSELDKSVGRQIKMGDLIRYHEKSTEKGMRAQKAERLSKLHFR